MVIKGANFTGANAVSFGGTAAAGFTVDSDTQITAIAGNGLPGRITVTTLSGTGASTGIFNFMNLAGGTPHGSSVSDAGSATTQQGPVPLASISVKSASLSASRVAPGTPVTVTADVANTGNAAGCSSIKLYVNGELDNTQGMTLGSGSATSITFTVSRSQPGTYSIYVDGVNAGSLVVDALANPDIILYISGALLTLAFVTANILLARRKY